MPEAPWTHPSGVRAVVDGWHASGAVRRCFAAEREFPAVEPAYAPIPPALSEGVRRALAKRGIRELYAHQAAAIAHASAGRHVVIATPTASGKSLCFYLPVIDALASDPAATALLLYPTKALARDQEHNLGELLADAGLNASAMVYDGDTPGDARRAVRQRCRIVLTNPDMLHAGILPNHAGWARFFQGLSYVVLDELHTYRGVFGSHMAHVLARLRRVARFHGKTPTFIAATATIGNPRQHAARLIGVDSNDVALVDRSGASRASREVYIYNPPVVNEELGVRASTLKQTVNLASDLVRHRVPTIVFGPSRNSVEVMLKYLRARVGDVAGSDAIMAYRGGYLPETRRRVEAGLRSGTILCVVATHALELGIDIGDLAAVVSAGYPGSIAGTWQRFGRAGRRGETSIAVLVCSSGAVDQYLAREPGYLLDSNAEEARIDPANLEVLIQHLKCAAFEAPFEIATLAQDSGASSRGPLDTHLTLDSGATRDALDYLAAHGLVHAAAGRYHWVGEAFPASSVSLRNIGWDNFVIIEVPGDRTIAELDFRAAHSMLHEQAIYQHDAEQYQVERLDFENHKAYVRKVEPDYFTTALSYRRVMLIEERERALLPRAALGFGDVKVLEKISGYKKIKFFTHENAGYGEVHLPEIEMHTTSFWLTLPEASVCAFELPRPIVIDGLCGVGAALETVSALALMCDPRDLGRTLGHGASFAHAEVQSASGSARGPLRDPYARADGGFDPTVFLFDAHPGGVGLAERIFERWPELLGRTRSLIQSCPCAAGCPACVGPGEEHSSRKGLAVCILDALLDADPSHRSKSSALAGHDSLGQPRPA